ncbi:glycoside hydrolase [bacterium]|nr:glycoside hydrolase [bacterium]
MRHHFIKILPVLGFFCLPVLAEDLDPVVDLSGQWRFEIGNCKNCESKKYNDSKWDELHVPGNWEDQGFPGYDGYAWYRTEFEISEKFSGATLYISLGICDDVDRVYVNGHFLNGSGSFPPSYETAWDRKRLYMIPNTYLDFKGKNSLAVQIYDHEGEGGIVKGKIGIYSKKQPYHINLNLAGPWKFMPGDNPEWRNAEFPDGDWPSIMVPGKWEHYGYPNLDGFAWYRKSFVMPADKCDDRWILILGRIDDVDEVYFNGSRIGQTGEFPDRTDLFIKTAYGILRLYSIPRTLFRPGAENVIAVRVFDSGSEGGIYEGPVGLISRDMYLKKKRYIH